MPMISVNQPLVKDKNNDVELAFISQSNIIKEDEIMNNEELIQRLREFLEKIEKK